MDQHQQQGRAGLLQVDDAAGHVQRVPGARLPQEAQVKFPHDEGRFRMGGQGVGHPQPCGQRRQPLHGALHVEAHVHVPHLVAFPGIDAAAPDRDPDGRGDVSSRVFAGFVRAVRRQWNARS